MTGPPQSARSGYGLPESRVPGAPMARHDGHMGEETLEPDAHATDAEQTGTDEAETDEVSSVPQPAPLDEALWDAIAAAALLRSQPQFDETVLDAWCGTGAAALPTAALVGPFGRVDAIDPDPEAIAALQSRAGRQFPQLHGEAADLADWATVGYDLVQCQLGLASCDTPDEIARHLVSLVKPGGRVVLSLWTQDAFAALDDLARAALDDAGDAADPSTADEEAPEEAPDEAPDQALPGSAGTLANLMHELGLVDVRAERVERHAALDPELAWTLVVSARRIRLDDLDSDALARVRERFIASVDADELGRVDASTNIAVGRRPV
jgi:SAM-dependent methyltransferase